jgi:hypothetical protein
MHITHVPLNWNINRANFYIGIGLALTLLIIWCVFNNREGFATAPLIQSICQTPTQPKLPTPSIPPPKPRDTIKPVVVPQKPGLIQPPPAKVSVPCKAGLNLAKPDPAVSTVITELTNQVKPDTIKTITKLEQSPLAPVIPEKTVPKVAELLTLLTKIDVSDETIYKPIMAELNAINPIVSQLANKHFGSGESNALSLVLELSSDSNKQDIVITDEQREVLSDIPVLNATTEQLKKNEAYIVGMANTGIINIDSELCYKFLTA